MNTLAIMNEITSNLESVYPRLIMTDALRVKTIELAELVESELARVEDAWKQVKKNYDSTSTHGKTKKKMKFHPDFLELVKSGLKTQTRRTHKNPQHEIGDIVEADFSIESLGIKIVYRRRQYLHNITAQDIQKEGFSSSLEFRQFWDQLYKDQPRCQWDANPLVYVYEFEIVGEGIAK